MPSNTFTLISSTTVGAGGASSIGFTSIPSTYTDLCLKLSGRSDYASTNNTMRILLNGTNVTFNFKTVFGDGSSAASNASTDNQYAGWLPAASATASVFGNNEYYFPNYTSSNQKSISCDTVIENNATSTFLGLVAGLWTGTSAINAISLSSRDGNLVQYTTAYLYGVKNA